MDKRLATIQDVRRGEFFQPFFLGFGREGRMSYMITTARGASVIVDLPAEARSTSEIRTLGRFRHINLDDFVA